MGGLFSPPTHVHDTKTLQAQVFASSFLMAIAKLALKNAASISTTQQ
jgi:hypothetical protein